MTNMLRIAIGMVVISIFVTIYFHKQQNNQPNIEIQDIGDHCIFDASYTSRCHPSLQHLQNEMSQ